jgi:L-fuculose-phosphate aldolase
MRNHGVLCCGPTVEQALQAVEDLETLCQDLLRQRIARRATQTPSLQAPLRRVLDALAG